ncbi:hypothetical protein [Candidatus Magnetaquicoccus inordinatus]|uniref:hypothetical protein n=1 Tax=Candidatus Magnetaquicoccus inordinatus TaxID=2496818 RepID=UPI00102B3F69|nr:hypothetical protein [Candidatus Magnetaquicoccus inordinatus]
MPRLFCLLLSVLLLLSSVYPLHADPPPWAGKGKHNQEDSENRPSRPTPQQPEPSIRHFNEQQVEIVRQYYSSAFPGARPCPPGLAKKNNGCLPPGQAKKWHKGYPLPADLPSESLPAELLQQLGPVANGYRLLRVVGDILKIVSGTRVVVDAIPDLGLR